MIVERRVKEADGLDGGEGDRDAEVGKRFTSFKGPLNDGRIADRSLGLERVDVAMAAHEGDEDQIPVMVAGVERSMKRETGVDLAVVEGNLDE